MDLLIKTFIKNPGDVEDARVRTAYGTFSGYVGIVANVLLFAAKLAAGIASGSVSITADAVNNLSDASSSVVSLLGFKLAARPADREHPYGHGRYEYLAGLTVAALIVAIGIELFRDSLAKILNPSPVEFYWTAMAVLAGSILLKFWMLRFYRKIGRAIQSQTLFAASADSRNDILATSGVLAAALISRYTGLRLDGWLGVAVAVFIVVNGFGLIRETLDPLLGRAPEEKEVRRIRKKIMRYPGVLGTHDLLVHDYGPGRRFASVHVEMAAEGDALESHDTITRMEQDFLEGGLHMLVHYDPIITEPGATSDLRGWLMELIREVHPKLTIHDLRVVPGKTRTKLVFDCLAPRDIGLGDKEMREAINRLVKERRPDYDCVVTVDHGFAAIPKESDA